MAAAVERFGGIDILINGVGGAIRMRPYAAFEPAQIEAEIRRSLFPTLWCCHAALPHLLARGGGVIVNISSNATRGIHRVPYSAAKGGVNALTQSLAMEYAAQNIRVVAAAPGGTKAPPRRIPRNPDGNTPDEQRSLKPSTRSRNQPSSSAMAPSTSRSGRSCSSLLMKRPTSPDRSFPSPAAISVRRWYGKQDIRRSRGCSAWPAVRRHNDHVGRLRPLGQS
jgi:NAD(P)-dependent dehydrogenase (short-subunit alcohol dehydrogenase family)